MGYQAAKLLHRLLAHEEIPLQRILVPPVRVVARQSTDYRSLTDPAVIQAMHYIRNHACKGIKVDQVLDSVGISRSNLEKRFKEEVGETIHRCAATHLCSISIRYSRKSTTRRQKSIAM